MTFRLISNLRGINIIFYRLLRHDKSLKHVIIFIWRVITSGTQNLLILIILARYHKPKGSSVVSSEYNRILCIFIHPRILFKGYMPIKIQHLMRPYCLKSIHHLSRSKSYALHREIFKVMIANIFPLGRNFFLGSDTLILRLNPCLNYGGWYQAH